MATRSRMHASQARALTKGRKLEKTINTEAKAAELEIASLLGPRQHAQLRHALEDLANKINNPATNERAATPVSGR